MITITCYVGSSTARFIFSNKAEQEAFLTKIIGKYKAEGFGELPYEATADFCGKIDLDYNATNAGITIASVIQVGLGDNINLASTQETFLEKIRINNRVDLINLILTKNSNEVKIIVDLEQQYSAEKEFEKLLISKLENNNHINDTINVDNFPGASENLKKFITDKIASQKTAFWQKMYNEDQMALGQDFLETQQNQQASTDDLLRDLPEGHRNSIMSIVEIAKHDVNLQAENKKLLQVIQVLQETHKKDNEENEKFSKEINKLKEENSMLKTENQHLKGQLEDRTSNNTNVAADSSKVAVISQLRFGKK